MSMNIRVSITKEIRVPDALKLERLRHIPSLGPRILFFSGGTALRDTSHALTSYTHNSIHLITPFDSGGSSAVLRKAFHMPAVGDIRNRLMALADKSLLGNPEIFEIFAYRLPKDRSPMELTGELESMIKGRHPLVAPIPDPMRKIIRNHLQTFYERMPKRFDLRGASIGNLVLTSGYLEHRRHLDPVIFLFSKMVRVLGVVRPVLSKDYHLAARMADGSVVVGQHLLTGKEASPIDQPIEAVWMTRGLDSEEPVKEAIKPKVQKLIADAELICYPVGSFFSSVLANLLPSGVGESIAANRCPKVFVPNTLPDPELFGRTLVDQVDLLLAYLMADTGGKGDAGQYLQYVLVDGAKGCYPGGLDREALEARGVQVVECDLVANGGPSSIDPAKLASVLVSFT